MINEIFGEHYTENDGIRFLKNELTNGSKKRIMDFLAEILKRMYHGECQSTWQKTVKTRMFEYDTMAAIEYIEGDDQDLKLVFPNSFILYVRDPSTVPDFERLQVVFGDGAEVIYSIRVIKVQNYSLEEIFEKNLLYFIPYYMLRYERPLKCMSDEQSLLEQMTGDLEKILTFLENNIAEEKQIYLFYCTKHILDYMLRDYQVFNERLGEIMGGRVLTFPIDRQLEQSRREGRREGRSEGRRQGRCETLRDNIQSLCLNLNITSAEAMDILNLTDKQRREYLQYKGYEYR